MGNHYHQVLHTRQCNLSRFMRHLNGVYCQRFNWRYGLVGHLFQGRFKAILVDREVYLFALCPCVERNPDAAGPVNHPGHPTAAEPSPLMASIRAVAQRAAGR